MATVYRVIANDDDSIVLSDLYNEDEGKYYREPALHFKDAKEEQYWDNDYYVLKFLRSLKKDKKEGKKILKDFCKLNDFDYETKRESLLEIFRMSKKLKYWKNENND